MIRMPACTLAGGTAMGVPDVCLTPAPPAPPIPTPYPNVAELPMSENPVTTVLVEMMPALAQGSTVPLSNGDQAGVAGGVASGMIMGEVQATVFSSKVSLGGRKAVLLTAMTGHNGASANTVGAIVAPSQEMVLMGL